MSRPPKRAQPVVPWADAFGDALATVMLATQFLDDFPRSPLRIGLIAQADVTAYLRGERAREDIQMHPLVEVTRLRPSEEGGA